MAKPKASPVTDRPLNGALAIAPSPGVPSQRQREDLMFVLKILTAGLGAHRPRVDLGLVLGSVGLIATGIFLYSAGTRGQAALRVELADLNVRQADQKNDHEELLKALQQVAARVTALEQEAAARQLPGIPPDVFETGSVADAPPPVVKPLQRGKRKGANSAQ